MNLDSIFGQIANTVRNHASDQTPGPAYDSNPLLDAIGGIFGQEAQRQGGQFGGYQREADYSNHGGFDPGQLFGGMFGGGRRQPNSARPLRRGRRRAKCKTATLSSDQDPYGDPGLQGGAQNAGYGNVKSSDEDPYGDPGLQR